MRGSRMARRAMFGLGFTLAIIPSVRGLAAEAKPREKTVAPPFDLRRLEGGRLSLAALKGKVVLLTFWTPG